MNRASPSIPYVVEEPGAAPLEGALDTDACPPPDGAPLVSCLMVTAGRPSLAARAIRCFQEQTYPEKELVILDSGPDATLARHVAALRDSRIAHAAVDATSKGSPLGALRNVTVRRARGTFISTWDDDDLSHVRRIEIQMAAIQATGADACFLARHRLLWLHRQRLGTSHRRLWESSMVCKKAVLPRFPSVPRGEDTPVALRVHADRRVVVLDAAELYAYVFHGRNTFGEDHFDALWNHAEHDEGAAYGPRLSDLLLGLPGDVARALAADVPGLVPDGARR